MPGSPILQGYQVTLRPVQQADLEQLRAWRNQQDVSQFMLSQDTISREQQQAWFNRICTSESEAHFIIEYKGEGIGSANIKARGIGARLAKAKCIEPGLYIANPKYRNNILAFSPTLLLNDYCFETLQALTLRAVVKPENAAALKYNQKIGYREVSRSELVEIELNFDDYQRHTAMIKGLLSRPSKKGKST